MEIGDLKGEGNMRRGLWGVGHFEGGTTGGCVKVEGLGLGEFSVGSFHWGWFGRGFLELEGKTVWKKLRTERNKKK